MKKRKKKNQIDRHLLDQNWPPIIEDTLSDREQGEFAQQLDALFQQELGENAASLYTEPEQSPERAEPEPEAAKPEPRESYVPERRRVGPAPASTPILPSAGAKHAQPVQAAQQPAPEPARTVSEPAQSGFTYEQADDLFAAIDDLLEHRSFLDRRMNPPQPAAPQPEPPAPVPEPAPPARSQKPAKKAQESPVPPAPPPKEKEKRPLLRRTKKTAPPTVSEPEPEAVIRTPAATDRILSDDDLFAAIDEILGPDGANDKASDAQAVSDTPKKPASLYHTQKEQIRQNANYWGTPKAAEPKPVQTGAQEDLSIEGQVSLAELLRHFDADDEQVAVAPVSRDTDTELTSLFRPGQMEPPAVTVRAEAPLDAEPAPAPAAEPAPEPFTQPEPPSEAPEVSEPEHTPAAPVGELPQEDGWDQSLVREKPKGILARLKAMLAGGIYADDEDEDEAEPAAPPAPPAPKKEREKPVHKEHGLTLEDFMAVAVPMEEADKPLHQKAVEALLEPDSAFDRPARPTVQADAPQEAQPEASAQAEPSATEPDAQPESIPSTPAETPAQTQEPVPSAAARPRPRPQTAPVTAERRQEAAQSARPRPRPSQPRPAEPAPRRRRRRVHEQVVLRPEEASRKISKELGSIGTRMVVLAFFEVIALFFTFYLTQGWSFLPTLFSGGATSYILLLLLIAMAITGREVYSDFFRSLADGSFTLGGLILLATLFAGLDTFDAAQNGRVPFAAVVGVLLLVALWGKYTGGMGYLTTLKVLRDQEAKVGITEVQDITQGRRGLTRSDPDVERFMAKLETKNTLSKIMGVYAPVACGLVVVGAVALSLAFRVSLFWAGTLLSLGAVPMAGLLAYERLFYLISQRLAASKAALCGYHGAEVFGGDHAILVGDDDLFPEGSLALNGFKVYSGNPDRIIAYAAAATRRSGSALFPLFDQLLDEHNGRHYVVDSFRFYDSGGIGAEIIGDVVLLGSLEFMRRMGVHMDGGTKVRQAVYVSLNGELAAVFAVKYNPPQSVQKGLASIARNRHFKTILVTRTFLGTPSFLKAKFGIPTSSLSYPPTRERLRLSEAEMKQSGAQGALLTKDSFVGFAEAAAGGRVLRSATALASFLALLGGAAGLVLMGILVSLPAYETATAVNLLWYILMWLIPTLLLSGWARHY